MCFIFLMQKITVADWRQGAEPMQVISGAMGKERIHYQAPDSNNVPHEMSVFLAWANDSQKIDSAEKRRLILRILFPKYLVFIICEKTLEDCFI